MRSPERKTLGPRLARVAELLGKPLMPWQRFVSDVALEIDPVTGEYAYDTVVLTVPRQSGKSTWILSKAVHRASATDFFGGRQRIVYTAQTRGKAREKWEEDYAADLKASKTFAPRIKPHFGNGNEHIRFSNGSKFGIEATTEKAGHGPTIDEAFIDEAFAQVDNRLEQAFRPAMITRANKQLSIVSTAGWLDASPFLLEKVLHGREQTEMGIREGLAYFEWSAPEDADPEDPAVWRACMPALGHTITEKAIAAEFRQMKLNDFKRAYLNQWVLKEDPDADSVIPGEAWAALEDVEEHWRPSPVAFSVEVSPDRAWASIGLAGLRSDGKYHVQVVQSGRGTSWLVTRLRELVSEWSPVAVTIDPASPAGSLIPDITREGIELVQVSGREVAQACGMFVDGVVPTDEEPVPTIRHSGQPLLAISIGAARKRPMSGAWVWRSVDKTDIAPLRAVTLALYGLAKALAQPQKKRSGVVV